MSSAAPHRIFYWRPQPWSKLFAGYFIAALVGPALFAGSQIALNWMYPTRTPQSQMPETTKTSDPFDFPDVSPSDIMATGGFSSVSVSSRPDYALVPVLVAADLPKPKYAKLVQTTEVVQLKGGGTISLSSDNAAALQAAVKAIAKTGLER